MEAEERKCQARESEDSDPYTDVCDGVWKACKNLAKKKAAACEDYQVR